jgi:hypothetical protein
MKTQREHAKQLWQLVLNYHRQRLGMPTDFNVERERAKFIAAIGDIDMTIIVRLAADLEVDRVLRNTVATGVVLSAEGKAVFREAVQIATLDDAAPLGLIPPPSQSRLAQLDTFLMHRKAAMHSNSRATLPSSAATLH